MMDPGSDFNKRLGDRLREVRSQRGLSQRQLARKAGTSNSLISRFEANMSDPPISVVKRIADAIPIGIAEFLGPAANAEFGAGAAGISMAARARDSK